MLIAIFVECRLISGYCSLVPRLHSPAFYRTVYKKLGSGVWELRLRLLHKPQYRVGMLVKFSCLERVPRFKSQPDTFSSFFLSLNFSLDLQCTCCNVTCINDPINRLLAIFQLPIISVDSSTNITALVNIQICIYVYPLNN